MPILAICPYCREGKVRAPDRAVGLSATCPKCFNCFTIIAAKEAAAELNPPPPPPSPRRPQSARPQAVPTAVAPSSTAVAVDRRTPAPAALPRIAVNPLLAPCPAPAPRPTPSYNDEPSGDREPQGDSSFAMAMIAITLAGIGLGLSQVPYG